MKVVHISSSDSGGAGIAALRLNKALNSIGVDSSLLCVHKSTNNDKVIRYNIPFISKLVAHSHLPILQNKYINNVELYEKNYEAVSFPEAIYDLSCSPLIKDADIINLHWVGNVLNYSKFFKNVQKPIFWTLHDMNPFMGISHYMGDFYKNQNRFGHIEDKVRNIKHKAILNANNLQIICLCDWMKQYSEKSISFQGLNHHIIHNSVDTEIFKIQDKISCRNILGLPYNKKILLFCSQSISNKRKGFDILLKSLTKISSNYFICIIGNINGIDIPKNIEYKCFGSLQDELTLSIIYSASDLFILPSREDNLPNTMLESLCCGVPVISFTNGGMCNVIQDGITGILVREQNSESLARGIDNFFEFQNKFNCKQISDAAREQFSPFTQATNYLEIYKQSLSC